MNNIDIQSVNEDINFIKKLIDDNSIEIKGISYGKQFRILRTIENILSEREQDKKRIKELEQKNEHLKYLYDDCCKCLLDTIEKQKVKEGLERIEDYFYRLNGPDEDIEYIRNVKKELLEEK